MLYFGVIATWGSNLPHVANTAILMCSPWRKFAEMGTAHS